MHGVRQQLEALLSETPAAARTRQLSAFDEAARGRRQVVLFGAGRLGRSVLRRLADTDLKVVAFADNNPLAWGTSLDGLPVLSPQDASREYADSAAFVITIWHPSSTALMATLLEQLQGLDCAAIPFPVLFWRHAEKFLPYFFWDLPEHIVQQREDILAAFDSLQELPSRQAFVAQIRLRLLADFEGTGAPVPGAQYFPEFVALRADECFVDCGSYTGDTIQSFVEHCQGRFRKVIAFEADREVLPGLERVVSGMGTRAVLHQSAVAGHRGKVSFAGNGIGGGAIVSGEGTEVAAVRLDDALAREQVTFIKMDIEGAELQALEGAQRIIWRDRPILAISGYHKPDHLWRVLTSLKTLAPDSELFVRSHCADGLDTVCYAVPPERRTAAVKQKPRTPKLHRATRAAKQGASV